MHSTISGANRVSGKIRQMHERFPASSSAISRIDVQTLSSSSRWHRQARVSAFTSVPSCPQAHRDRRDLAVIPE
jgi:hypothetical protein